MLCFIHNQSLEYHITQCLNTSQYSVGSSPLSISRHSCYIKTPPTPPLTHRSPSVAAIPGAHDLGNKSPSFIVGSAQDSPTTFQGSPSPVSTKPHGEGPCTLYTAALQHSIHQKFQSPQSFSIKLCSICKSNEKGHTELQSFVRLVGDMPRSRQSNYYLVIT